MIAYLATNRVNGAKYVGITSASLRKRKNEHRSSANLGSGNLFHIAIREHGFDAFDWRVFAETEDREFLFLIEAEAVDKFSSHRLDGGYNMTIGGSGVAGHVWTQESRDKLRKAMIGRYVSAETRARLSSVNKGRAPSKACIDALKSRVFSQEERARLSARAKQMFTGRKLSEANKAAMLDGRLRKEGHIKIGRPEIIAVLTMRDAGMSLKSIASEYDCTPSAVHHFIGASRKRIMK